MRDSKRKKKSNEQIGGNYSNLYSRQNTLSPEAFDSLRAGWATSLVGGPDLLKKILCGPD